MLLLRVELAQLFPGSVAARRLVGEEVIKCSCDLCARLLKRDAVHRLSSELPSHRSFNHSSVPLTTRAVDYSIEHYF